MLSDYPGMRTWHQGVRRSVRWPMFAGVAVLGVGMLGFGAWAGLAPLDGAVVAGGSFVATSQNKPVQHLEGGIIGELLVAEGDIAEAGQVLVRLDETAVNAKLRRLVLRKYRHIATQAALEAQIAGEAAFDMPSALAAAADDAEAKKIYERQRMQLRVRQVLQADEEEVFRKEISGLREARRGYESQLATVEQRIELFAEELKAKRELLDRQLIPRSDVMTIQRAEASLVGERGQLIGRIAEARERAARAEQRIAQLRSTTMRQAVEELRASEAELADIEEQIRAQRDILERLEVKAPVRGVVVKLHYASRGAVISPGAVILELLPMNDKIVVEARVDPRDISHVHEGQDALVRLTALNKRLTPVVAAEVIYVSADAIQAAPQQQTGAAPQSRPSFIARVQLDEEDVREKTPGFQPTPGMPADVYIKTGERTFLGYILKPVLDSFARSFREY